MKHSFATGIATTLIELTPLMLRTVKPQIQKAGLGRITHPQYRILANINRGLDTISEIAIHQGVSQPAMSKMVDGLVKKGWVERTSTGSDRRKIQLVLSSEGSQLFREIKKTAAKNLSHKLRMLSEKDSQKLIRALAEIENFLKLLNAKDKDKENP